ncbi:MAG: hypothetical protein R3D71_00785 [Rickettsiales bacterium]
MAEDNKPVAVDQLLMAQRMQGAGGGNNDDAQQPDPDDTTNNSYAWIERIFGIKIASFFSTGIFAHIKLPQAWSDKKMNQMAAQMNSRGGSVASFTGRALKLGPVDFSNLTKPAIENPAVSGDGGLQFANVSREMLGNLTPLNTGDNRKASGIQIT